MVDTGPGNYQRKTHRRARLTGQRISSLEASKERGPPPAAKEEVVSRPGEYEIPQRGPE